MKIDVVIGVMCLTAGYCVAAFQGINGMLFVVFSNAVTALIVGGVAYGKGKQKAKAKTQTQDGFYSFTQAPIEKGPDQD